MSAAITARLGLDIGPFKSSWSQAEVLAAKASAGLTQSVHKSAEAHESLFRGERRVESGARNLGLALASVQSGADVGTAALEAFHSILRLPLPTAFAAIGAVIAFEKVKERIDEIKKANIEARQELANPANTAALAQGPEAVRARMEAYDKQIDALRESRGDAGKSVATGAFASLFAGADAAKSERLETELQQRRGALAAALAGKVREETAAREQAADASERQSQILESQLSLEKEIGKIRAENNDPGLRAALIAEARSRADLREEEIGHKFDAAGRAVGQENSLAYINATGDNVAERSARSKINFARSDLDAARNDEERAAAAARLASLEQELAVIQRQTAETREQLRIREQLAGYQGTAGQKEALALSLQEAELRRQLETAKPDQARELNAQLAENQAAQRENSRQLSGEAFAQMASEIAAAARPGEAGQAETLVRELGLAQRRRNVAEGQGAGAPELAGLDAEIAKLKQGLLDLLNIRARITEKAHEETGIMEQQAEGHKTLADQMRINAEYEERMAQARRDGNLELERQLNTQRKIALDQLAAQEFLKTPSEKMKEQREQREQARALRTIRAREKDQDDRVARGAHLDKAQLDAYNIRHCLQPRQNGNAQDLKTAINESDLNKKLDDLITEVKAL